MKSWKTTAAAIVGVIAIILTQVGALLDADPSTVANWGAVTPAVVACIGLLFAKDDTKEA